MKHILIIACVLYFTFDTIAQKHGAVKQFRLKNHVKIDMIYIAPGKFMMGSPASELERNPNREQQHQVTLTRGFWIAKNETSQLVWKQITGKNPSKIKNELHPVEQVSWNQVIAFIQKINKAGAKFRLPTEAEWEYACRAGTTSAYSGERDQVTWHRLNAGGTTHPIGSKKPNAWGVYNMHGNVSELCQDWFEEDISQDSTDPSGPVTGERKVERGGQYTGRLRHTRSADRSSGLPSGSAFFVGFRLVHD
jgi:formylglycine-generating enzyme required for sulfatase activity